MRFRGYFPYARGPVLKAAVAAFALFAAAGPGGEISAAEVNSALEQDAVKVFVSAAPNPAWPASQVNDGLVDTTRGWLASADEGSAWVAFEFKTPVKVSGIVFYQAGLTEGGDRRFSRPRQLRISIGGSQARVVELSDSERKPQKVDFTPVPASSVKIDILSNYTDAKFPFLTGFQEIEIYSTDVVNFIDGNSGAAPSKAVGAKQSASAGAAETSGTPAAPPSPAAAGKVSQNNGPAGETSVEETVKAIESAISRADGDEDGLDAEELELLNLLREFTARLEEYFRKKNTETN